MIYDAAGRETLSGLYRQYLDIGREYDLPLIVGTPTWRANPERLRAAGLDTQTDVNADAVRFVAAICARYCAYAERVFIGGLMGPRGDAYRAADALSVEEAAAFHRAQAHALAAGGVDFLMAATLPAASEAHGLAKAMAGCGVPYILSFIGRPTGTLLDGTPLHEVIAQIDAEVRPSPLAYMVNCVHPRAFAEAVAAQTRLNPAVRERLIGLQANTSVRSPEELDGLEQLDSETPEAFAEQMLGVHRQHGTRILGGCCGTDDRHIRCLAAAVCRTSPP
jgi:homocysteine S-methyltransferase